MVFTSLRDPQETTQDETADRLRFVSQWFRVLGFLVVVLWILLGVVYGVVFLADGFGTRDRGYAAIGLLIAIGVPIVGVTLTAPIYFWFSAIAGGVATLVDRSKA